MKNDMIVLVDSFDGYSDLWAPFFHIFKKRWSDCPYDVKLISNEKTFDGADTIRTGKEVSWADRTLRAVEQTEAKYILLLLEDYLLGKDVSTEEIQNLVAFMETKNAKYLRLTNIPKSRYAKKDETSFPLYADEEYAINLQAAIWEREFLLDALRKYPGSAWEFEVGFLRQTVGAESKPMAGCYGVKNDPLAVINGVLKGKWFPAAVRYCKKFGFEFAWQERGKLPMLALLKYKAVFFLKNHISYGARKKLKAISRKFGAKFVSDI